MKTLFLCFMAFSLSTMARADLTKIQGTWKAKSGQMGDFKMPKTMLDKMILKIKGDAYDYDEGHGHDIGTLKDIKGTSPQAMDIVGTQGPNKGKTFLTIYKFEKNVLTICYGLDGTRPKSFDEKGKRLLMTYELFKSSI